MQELRLRGAVVGLGAAAFGAGVSELAAGALTLRNGPLPGFGEAASAVLPAEFVVHNGIDLVAIATGPLLWVLLVLALGSLAVSAGTAAVAPAPRRRDRWRRPVGVTLLVMALGALSEIVRPDATPVDVVPALAGGAAFAVALVALAWVARHGVLRPGQRTPEASRDAEAPGVRRRVVLGAGLAAVLGAAAVVAGEVVGRSRRAVEQGRRLLRLTMVSAPRQPDDVGVGLDGVAPWTTPNDEFYRQDAAVVVPAIAAEDWTLRIHGEVEREVVLTYEDLIDLDVREQWITLVGLTYEPGGEQVGNAWWSGVPTHVLLQRAGVLTGADAVVQTGQDGWRCVTSTQVLGDPGRRALLAFAMNGEALPLEHGFPARTIVPGLHGQVAACKWVVDWEVTRLETVQETWDENRPLRAPVRIGARIDVPAAGAEVPAGRVAVGGAAWAPPIGVGAVEVALDDGGWSLTTLGAATATDSWAQWRAELDLAPGTHVVRVRARDRVGGTQEAEPSEDDEQLPGAVGLHEIEIEVVEPEG